MSGPKADQCLEMWQKTVQKSSFRLFCRDYPLHIVIDEILKFLRYLARRFCVLGMVTERLEASRYLMPAFAVNFQSTFNLAAVVEETA